jgi:hypothetical protein
MSALKKLLLVLVVLLVIAEAGYLFQDQIAGLWRRPSPPGEPPRDADGVFRTLNAKYATLRVPPQTQFQVIGIAALPAAIRELIPAEARIAEIRKAEFQGSPGRPRAGYVIVFRGESVPKLARGAARLLATKTRQKLGTLIQKVFNSAAGLVEGTVGNLELSYEMQQKHESLAEAKLTAVEKAQPPP